MRSFKTHVRQFTFENSLVLFCTARRLRNKYVYFNVFFFPDSNVSSYEKIYEDTRLRGRKALWTSKFLPRIQSRLKHLFQDEAAEEFLDLNPYQHHSENLKSRITRFIYEISVFGQYLNYVNYKSILDTAYEFLSPMSKILLVYLFSVLVLTVKDKCTTVPVHAVNT